MKRQGSSNSHLGREQETDRLQRMLRDALPPVGEYIEPPDLWPAMQCRLRTQAARPPFKIHVPWFDWALAGGLVTLLAVFPAWIPVMLYYL